MRLLKSLRKRRNKRKSNNQSKPLKLEPSKLHSLQMIRRYSQIVIKNIMMISWRKQQTELRTQKNFSNSQIGSNISMKISLEQEYPISVLKECIITLNSIISLETKRQCFITLNNFTIYKIKMYLR